MRVRFSPAAQSPPTNCLDLPTLAYVIGAALGDGTLSSPNGRVACLRITCDNKYPQLMKRIMTALETVLPNNKVNTIKRPKNCTDVYVYSKKLEDWLGWQVGKGSKYVQKVSVPTWIKSNATYTKRCLQGLFETDGSVYFDRGYLMTNFVTIIPTLAKNVGEMIASLNYISHTYYIKQKPPQHNRYNIRISKNMQEFIDLISIDKS